MESALTPLANGVPHEGTIRELVPGSQREIIILPTEDERARLQALGDVKALHERTKPLMVAPSSADSYIFLGEQLKLVRVAKKTLVGLWRPYVDELLKQKNEAFAEMSRGVTLMDEIEATGDQLLLDYDRITKEAAQRQQAQVQQIVNDQSRQEAQAASDEQRLNLALEAENSGNHALAEEIINTPALPPVVMPPAVVLQTQTPQIEGFSKRVTWKGRLKGSTEDNPVPPSSLALLIKAVAEDLFVWSIAEEHGKQFIKVKERPVDQRRCLISLLDVNESSLNNKAKDMKAQFNIPGCESYEKTGLAKRV